MQMKTFIESILNGIFAIILPVASYLYLIGAFISLNTFYGIWASNKNGVKIDYERLFKSIAKKIAVYTPAMISLFWMDKTALNEITLQFINIDLLITRIGCIVLSSSEIISINKHIKTVHGKSLSDMGKQVLKTAKKAKNEVEELKK